VIFESLDKEKGPVAAIVENISVSQDIWWPDFFKHYVRGDFFYRNSDFSAFIQTVDDIWNINDENDLAKVFSSDDVSIGEYPDLSAKRFMINLNYAAIDKKKDLVINIEEKSGAWNPSLSILAYVVVDENLVYVGESKDGILHINNLKEYYDKGGRKFLLVGVNSAGEQPFDNYSNINLNLTIEEAESEYTKCWVRVKVGPETYKKTNLNTGNSFNSSTSGESFGEITYEGSFLLDTFSGSYQYYTESDTVSGDIIVDLNETRDQIIELRFTKKSKHIFSSSNGTSYREIDFYGLHIPIEDSEDPSTFSINGNTTCNYIIKLNVLHQSRIPNDPNNNYDETLEKFECDNASEIKVYFSK
jgi:hypothetical protein